MVVGGATAVLTRNDWAGAESCQLRRLAGLDGGVTPTPMPAMEPCRGGRASGDSGDGAIALWFRREAALRASSWPVSSRRSSSRAAANDMRFRLLGYW